MAERLIARALSTPEGRAGAVVLAALAVVALAAPAIAPGDPLDIVARPLLPPFADASHPLGTDRLGRDLAAGLVHGARASLLTAACVALIAIGCGVALGLVAGGLGGAADEAVMRLADAVQTAPPFVVALAVVSALGPSLGAVVAALAVSAWTAPARVVRAETLRLVRAPYVEASRLLGRSRLAIAFTVIVPNAVGVAVALAAVVVAGALLSEAALSFLGLGDPNRASWGAMMAEGRSVLRTAPHVILAPGLALFVTVLAVALLGEGLAKALAARSGDGA
jgi:peptide/nickel transport system permease protein